MKILTLLMVLVLAVPGAMAQDREGNNTPGDWDITHHQAFGLWDSVCDERETEGVFERRCYLRYVDVYSKAPQFGAMFSFVNATDRGLTLDISYERGTRFEPQGFRIEKAGEAIWVNRSTLCLHFRRCFWSERRSGEMLDRMVQGDRLVFNFTDAYDRHRRLVWDLRLFEEALADQRREALARGLLGG